MRLLHLGLLSVVLPVSVASADSILITNGVTGEGLGTYTGSMDLTGSVLTVTLTNTSPVANGGLITGFVFNGRDGATATLASGPVGFQDLGPTEAAPPWGEYDYGAAFGADWSGGGAPGQGIAVGGTGVFTFSTTDADTVWDFFTDGGLLKEAKNDKPAEYSDVVFAVRFKGFQNGKSDKAPGIVYDPPVVVPLPPAVLGGAFLMSGMLIRRMRRGAAA